MLDLDELVKRARESVPPATWDYYAGGAGEERTLACNEQAWSEYWLRPRVLVDVSHVTTRTTVVGHSVRTPVLVAPTALQRLGHEDGEVAVARAAAATGSVYVLSTAASATPQEVAVAAPDGHRWLQLDLHRDRRHSDIAIKRAHELGFSSVVLTVDSPVPGIRRRDIRNDFQVPASMSVPGIPRSESGAQLARDEFFAINDPSATWTDFAKLASSCPMPLIVKGVQTADDAVRAQNHGASGIIVSNHGGRQLDGVAPTAEILLEVAGALSDEFPIMVDGGIRRAADVVVALALGASAVFIGRPMLWALISGGEDGCRQLLEDFESELANALALMGCASPDSVERRHVSRARHGITSVGGQ